MLVSEFIRKVKIKNSMSHHWCTDSQMFPWYHVFPLDGTRPVSPCLGKELLQRRRIDKIWPFVKNDSSQVSLRYSLVLFFPTAPQGWSWLPAGGEGKTQPSAHATSINSRFSFNHTVTFGKTGNSGMNSKRLNDCMWTAVGIFSFMHQERGLVLYFYSIFSPIESFQNLARWEK